MPVEHNKEEYIGDGLYVSFDGWQFKLRAPRPEGDHEVFLEPRTHQSYVRFVEKAYEAEGPTDGA